MFRKILWWRYYFFILLFTIKVKWRQAKNLAPFYTDCKWQSWDLKPGILGPESALGHKPWCHLSRQPPPPPLPPPQPPTWTYTHTKPEWPAFSHTQNTVSWFACVVFSLGKHFFLLFAWTLFNLQTLLYYQCLDEDLLSSFSTDHCPFSNYLVLFISICDVMLKLFTFLSNHFLRTC